MAADKESDRFEEQLKEVNCEDKAAIDDAGTESDTSKPSVTGPPPAARPIPRRGLTYPPYFRQKDVDWLATLPLDSLNGKANCQSSAALGPNNLPWAAGPDVWMMGTTTKAPATIEGGSNNGQNESTYPGALSDSGSTTGEIDFYDAVYYDYMEDPSTPSDDSGCYEVISYNEPAATNVASGAPPPPPNDDK